MQFSYIPYVLRELLKFVVQRFALAYQLTKNIMSWSLCTVVYLYYSLLDILYLSYFKQLFLLSLNILVDLDLTKYYNRLIDCDLSFFR